MKAGFSFFFFFFFFSVAVYLQAWLRGVCSNKWSQTMMRNQDFISQLKATDRLMGPARVCQPFWNYRYMWHVRQEFVRIQTSRRKRWSHRAIYKWFVFATNRAWSLSTWMWVIFILSFILTGRCCRFWEQEELSMLDMWWSVLFSCFPCLSDSNNAAIMKSLLQVFITWQIWSCLIWFNC